jgi:peptide/nickel transport system ATP-binding protein
MNRDDMREARTRMQMIFQDPISSLNPRRKVRDIVMEPLTIWKRGHQGPNSTRRSMRCCKRSASILNEPRRASRTSSPAASASASRSPRSLVLDPTLIICDEPVSASRRQRAGPGAEPARRPQGKYGLTLIFIAHDLAVVKNISDRVR